MCGIVGFINHKSADDEVIIEQMTQTLHHRGPDDTGICTFQSNHDMAIALGHKRLSILDLSKSGHQPMQHDNVHLVYNGEVYNFQEIQKDLIKEGYTFSSHSDTEVILKAYHCWGISCINRFNGMFSMAIVDQNREKLFLVRDRAGVKPLFWYQKGNVLLFSSELKAFHKHPSFEKVLNQNALALFLAYQYIPAPHTIFENCYKVKSGHFLEIDLTNQKIEEKSYWDIYDFYNKPKLKIDEGEVKEELNSLFTSSFSYRMVSDVPVGVFLSGGYDSTLVTSILQKNYSAKLKTFTIGFHERGFDEAPYAKAVAKHLGTEHTAYYCTQKDALDIIPKLAKIYDEPFADASAIPTILVSTLAKKDVSVTLSADGGDELFAGYEKYERILGYHQDFAKIPQNARKPLGKLLSAINPQKIPFFSKGYNFALKYEKATTLLQTEDITQMLKVVSQFLSHTQLHKLFKHPPQMPLTDFDSGDEISEQNDYLSRIQAVDFKTYMGDDVLQKVDRATMSVSLEGREPLLDYRIAEFAAQLPSNFKYRNGEKKYILKSIVHDLVPKELMDRPKMGFGVPLTQWFKEELKTYFHRYLDPKRLEEEGIFHVEEVIRLKERYLLGANVDVDLLWSLLMFEMWYEEWMS